MRNLISFFILSTVFFLTSCSQEAVLNPAIDRLDTIAERSTTLELEVTQVEYEIDNGIISVAFSATYDFTEAILEPTQYLTFDDGSGNISTLTFSVNTTAGTNGTLDADFQVDGNNLAGLHLVEIQEIIIEDLIVE